MKNLTRRKLLHLLFSGAGLALMSAQVTSLPRIGKVRGAKQEARPGKVTSKDGTRIAFLRSGAGPPLVLVYGTSSDHTRWAPVLSALQERFTVYAMERRGRGASGDTQPFSFEREFEDVVALIDSIQEPVYLLGHSYGGICCLEALLRTKNIAKLILYDPPLTSGLAMDAETEKIDARIEEAIQKGDKEKALLIFSCEIVRRVPSSEGELTKLRLDPTWKARVAVAHTIPRERKAVKNYHFQGQRFEQVKTPMLLLMGEKSPTGLITSTKMVEAALSTSRISIMAGQSHNAMATAPDIFTREVTHFLLD